MDKQHDQGCTIYRTRLSASIDCALYLLRQGLAFRGHDESEESINQGNFLELLKFLGDHNEDINKVILKNAPENNQMIAPSIQKNIVSAAAYETTNLIMNDLGDDLFTVMVDESRDNSNKEQMAIAILFVDKYGKIVERFIGIVHVSDTSSLTLKDALVSFLSKHRLSISRIRGQGYDGASNMRGEFNGLKSLILKENPSAFYVHCFAHQLQLTLVAVAKGHVEVATFFNILAVLLNVVNGSSKRHDMLRDIQSLKVKEALSNIEILSGRGLNQEQGFQRPGDTCWGSHHRTLLSLIELFSSILTLLDNVMMQDGGSPEQKGDAQNLLDIMCTFHFVFVLHLMRRVLGITSDLSKALQRKDQDMPNAIRLLDGSKKRLQDMRDNGWDSLFEEVCSFCDTHDIQLLHMNERYIKGRSRRNAKDVDNLHHYRVDLFYNVIDMQLIELNDRFTETTSELFICLSCFDPVESFSTFDKKKLIRLSQLYSYDFSEIDVLELDDQLENFIHDVRHCHDFSGLKGASSLAEKLVATRRNLVYPVVYRLLKLILLLPVATTTVERAFLAMNIVKSNLRNRMGNDWLNNCLVTYIENEVFRRVEDESIIQRFQHRKTRWGVL